MTRAQEILGGINIFERMKIASRADYETALSMLNHIDNPHIMEWGNITKIMRKQTAISLNYFAPQAKVDDLDVWLDVADCLIGFNIEDIKNINTQVVKKLWGGFSLSIAFWFEIVHKISVRSSDFAVDGDIISYRQKNEEGEVIRLTEKEVDQLLGA